MIVPTSTSPVTSAGLKEVPSEETQYITGETLAVAAGMNATNAG